MSKKDIEEFVEAPGRDDKIKEVRKKIDELGITYLYLQFVSVTGRIPILSSKECPSEDTNKAADEEYPICQMTYPE